MRISELVRRVVDIQHSGARTAKRGPYGTGQGEVHGFSILKTDIRAQRHAEALRRHTRSKRELLRRVNIVDPRRA